MLIKFIRTAFLGLTFFFFSLSSSYSQTGVMNYNKAFDKIKTIKLEVLGADLSFPVIALNSDQQLLLQFDDLSGEFKEYYYRFVHCNSNWTQSGMLETDYIDGFFDNQIEQAKLSFNTIQNYYHYELAFPNQDFKFKLSGNYIVYVYSDYNAKEPIFTRRFSILDEKVLVSGTVKRSILAKYTSTHQQIDFTISTQDFEIGDPYSDVKVVIVQNNNWHTAKVDLKPTFVRNKQLLYTQIEDNAFPGNNEFRAFDIKSLKYNRENVVRIFYEDSTYYVRLADDEERRFKVYLHNSDINGTYIIRNRDYEDFKLSSEYVQVYFYLPMPEPFPNGDLYVYGELSSWNVGKHNKMAYNYEKRAYQLMLKLKQGYYNYEYVYVDRKDKNFDISKIESSHYETENDYQIYVYAKGFGDEYDRLVGYKVLNSLRDNTSIFQD